MGKRKTVIDQRLMSWIGYESRQRALLRDASSLTDAGRIGEAKDRLSIFEAHGRAHSHVWYTGNPQSQHKLLDSSRNEVSIRYAEGLMSKGTASSKRLAEAILERVRFDTIAQVRTLSKNGNLTTEALKKASSDIDRVHRIFSNEIRSRWDQPVMSDQEIADAAYSAVVVPMLEKSGIPAPGTGSSGKVRYETTLGNKMPL